MIEEAVRAIKNSVGDGEEIDVIVMTGGGAKLYMPAIKRKFPRHEVVLLNHPTSANVLGFQALGGKVAASAARATGMAKAA